MIHNKVILCSMYYYIVSVELSCIKHIDLIDSQHTLLPTYTEPIHTPHVCVLNPSAL